jgi:hypothetical protein
MGAKDSHLIVGLHRSRPNAGQEPFSAGFCVLSPVFDPGSRAASPESSPFPVTGDEADPKEDI